MSYKPRTALKVLVVDDDPFAIEVLTMQLRDLGIRDITTAADGALALQALEQKKGAYDLMLSDLHMPRMDGFEFIVAATKTGFTGGLVIVSGQNSDILHSAGLVAQLRRVRLLGTVSKPVKREDLSRLIPY